MMVVLTILAQIAIGWVLTAHRCPPSLSRIGVATLLGLPAGSAIVLAVDLAPVSP